MSHESVLPEADDIARVFRVPLDEIAGILAGSSGRVERAWAIVTRQFLPTIFQHAVSKNVRWEMRYSPPRRLVETLSSGEIWLDVDLATDFHRSLVTEELLGKLRAFLRSQEFGQAEQMSGRLFSIYNEDRYMGPESVVKYRFEVHLYLSPSTALLARWLRVRVEFRPKVDGFICRGLRQGVTWNNGPLRDAVVGAGLLSREAWRAQVSEYKRLALAYEWAGGLSLATHLVREKAITEKALLEVLLQHSDLTLASEAELADCVAPSGHFSQDLLDLGWALEVPDSGPLVIGRLVALDAVEHIYGDYREIRLSKPELFRVALEKVQGQMFSGNEKRHHSGSVISPRGW